MKSSARSISLHEIFKKSQLSIFAITLCICSFTFVTISVMTIESYAKQNLQLISQTVAERIQPALVFQDQFTIDHILQDSIAQHDIRKIRVLSANDQVLADIKHDQQRASYLQLMLEKFFFNEAVQQKITHQNRVVGQLEVYGSSDQILRFILKILFGLAVSMLFIMWALWRSIRSMYRYLMQNILPIQHMAQVVSDQKAYNLRFPNSKITEFQNLNNTFNELLEEIHTWHNHLQSENHQLSYEAKHDHLTQIPNRNYFTQTLQQIYADQDLRQQTVLCFIDNNNFKEINDQFGHLVGDAVLQETAKRLLKRVRHNDVVARLGGDEFAIILKSIHNHEHLAQIAENLLQSCQEPLQYADQKIYFTFSIGIALAKNTENLEELMSQADQAMYKAKNLEPHWYIFIPDVQQ